MKEVKAEIGIWKKKKSEKEDKIRKKKESQQRKYFNRELWSVWLTLLNAFEM